MKNANVSTDETKKLAVKKITSYFKTAEELLAACQMNGIELVKFGIGDKILVDGKQYQIYQFWQNCIGDKRSALSIDVAVIDANGKKMNKRSFRVIDNGVKYKLVENVSAAVVKKVAAKK